MYPIKGWMENVLRMNKKPYAIGGPVPSESFHEHSHSLGVGAQSVPQ